MTRPEPEPEQYPRCQDCGRPMPTGTCTLRDCFSTWGKEPENPPKPSSEAGDE